MKYLGKKYRNKSNGECTLISHEGKCNLTIGNGVLMPIHQFVKFYEEITETETETRADEIQKLEDKYDVRLAGFPKEMWVWDDDETTKTKELVLLIENNEYIAYNRLYDRASYKNAKDI